MSEAAPAKPSTPQAVSKIFHADSGGDIVFRSSDNVLFYVHHKNLDFMSEGFPPVNHTIPPKEPVALSKDSKTLELLFQYTYPSRMPPDLDDLDFNGLMKLAEAAEKYVINHARGPCVKQMSVKFVPEKPFTIFVFACNYDHENLMYQIAPRLVDRPLSAFLYRIPPGIYHPWSLYRDQLQLPLPKQVALQHFSDEKLRVAVCEQRANIPPSQAGFNFHNPSVFANYGTHNLYWSNVKNNWKRKIIDQELSCRGIEGLVDLSSVPDEYKKECCGPILQWREQLLALSRKPQRDLREYVKEYRVQKAKIQIAFQLQEYISLLIRLDVHDVDAIISIPGTAKSSTEKVSESASGSDGPESGSSTEEKEKSTDSKKNEVTVDEPCWIYEQLRRLAQDLSHPLITTLQQECNRSTCPEMKAGEWLYLCVAHGNDGAMEQCCAIDYILHTIDSATALLNSPRAFPSRLQIPPTSHRHFSSLARRLGRIFAHAYFHHREAFEQAEAESSLYARFLALTSKFDLVPAEFLVIPPRHDDRDGDVEREVQPPKLLAAGLNPMESSGSQEPRQAQTSGTSDPGSTSAVRDDWPRNLQVERSKSNSPSRTGQDSPRRVGRSRTDTMVHSDASSVVEELAKAEEEHHPVPPVPKSSSESTTSQAPPQATTTHTQETAPSEQPAPAATSTKEEDAPALLPANDSDIIEEPVREPSTSSASTTALEEELATPATTLEETPESAAEDTPAVATESVETEQPSESSPSESVEESAAPAEEPAHAAEVPASHPEPDSEAGEKTEAETTEASESVTEDKPVEESAPASTVVEEPEPTAHAEAPTAEETSEDATTEKKEEGEFLVTTVLT
ncbi:hypothetical protein D9758_010335 [Tetrapyrgos nigripes]|uniref:BTB domain-containing protein n=1 Tax=Tetrapyrgos nigripes TaxID=182062 RepID=A0A8H5CZC8_9AGAR|nr:hypothetical protein D9758_010335 [Tetrapyrgos nigripes]